MDYISIWLAIAIIFLKKIWLLIVKTGKHLLLLKKKKDTVDIPLKSTVFKVKKEVNC